MKAGGQLGHTGKNLIIDKETDEIIRHMPFKCEGCANYTTSVRCAPVAESRYVADAVVQIYVTAHEALEIKYSLCGETKKHNFPEDIKTCVQYGENLKALIVALNTVGLSA